MIAKVREIAEVPRVQLLDRVVDFPCVAHRQVPMVQKVPKTVEMPQVQDVEKNVQVPQVQIERPVPVH